MARTRTLAQLRADVCYRGDFVDGGSGGRHSSANLNRLINQAIQEFRRQVTEAGCDVYIAQSATTCGTSATPDASNWAPRDYLALPSDFYHLKGVDISLNGTTVAMMDFAQIERNIFKQIPSWLSNSGVGMPVMYKLGGFNAAGARVVKVIPSADSAYPCVIWYLPVPPDLAQDSDTFDGIAGYEDWIVNRAAAYALARDQASQPMYQALMLENAKLEQKMALEFATSNGVLHRVDTKALRNYLEQVSRGNFGFM